MSQQTAVESQQKEQWTKPFFGRPPIAIPDESGQTKPFLLNFAKRPDIEGPEAGNTTYMGQTPTDKGHVQDYTNDDA